MELSKKAFASLQQSGYLKYYEKLDEKLVSDILQKFKVVLGYSFKIVSIFLARSMLTKGRAILFFSYSILFKYSCCSTREAKGSHFFIPLSAIVKKL